MLNIVNTDNIVLAVKTSTKKWFSCRLSLRKRREMRFSHTEAGAGPELGYHVSR